jgi:hypothetical protein
LDGTNACFLHEVLCFGAVTAENHGITVEPIEHFIEKLAEEKAFLGRKCHVHVGHAEKGRDCAN